ncbi:MAG TPA: cupredoxin domain-containing protein [Acidimicrobiia bacterium]|nr:cupredoxin domain-containing protein [Acidimicrobiia bacterium]
MRRLLLAVSALAAIVACGGDSASTTEPSATPDPADPSMTIQGRSFGQAPEVAAGESFTVINQDGVRHTVTSPDGLWEEVSVAGGQSAVFTVPADVAAGTYNFVCVVHPDMGGRLTVSG